MQTTHTTATLMEQILYQVKRVVVGQDRFLERVMVAMLAQGHLLVEGVPGLAKTPTLVVLSACYSGAFLEPLRAPNRVVLTATDVHKASFKCQYPGEYTFFADALFNQAGAEQLSITQWMGAAQKSIQAQEKRKRLASSAPKMFVGEEAKAWASQPLKSWLQAR